MRREVGDIIQATKIREFSTLGLVLGAHYADSPIVVSDGTSPPPEHSMHYVPSACPGCLAPHLWLADGSSLYDQFGLGFTLLTMDGADGSIDAVTSSAARRGIPLMVLVPDDPRLRPHYAARFALIRPDQHVAWRGDQLPANADSLLARVTGNS